MNYFYLETWLLEAQIEFNAVIWLRGEHESESVLSCLCCFMLMQETGWHSLLLTPPSYCCSYSGADFCPRILISSCVVSEGAETTQDGLTGTCWSVLVMTINGDRLDLGSDTTCDLLMCLLLAPVGAWASWLLHRGRCSLFKMCWTAHLEWAAQPQRLNFTSSCHSSVWTFPDILQDVETRLQYYLRVQASVSEIPKQLHKLSVGVDDKTDKNSNGRKILKLNIRCKFKNRLIHM